MRLTSSKMTFFYKRIFPVIWFGFLAVFFLIALVQGLAADPISNLPFLIVPVVMAIVGYQIMKKMSFGLVDEVFDLGDALLVRNGGQEERIALADIKNVNFFPLYEPAAGHLVAAAAEHLWRDDCVLCAGPVMPLSRSPMIEELIDRIDAARQER